MEGHIHGGVGALILTTIYAVVGLNILRIIAAHLVNQNGFLGEIGKSLGALTAFSGTAA